MTNHIERVGGLPDKHCEHLKVLCLTQDMC